MEATILLTGFKPFDNYYYNTSEIVVDELNNSSIKGYRVVGVVLPVSLKRSLKLLDDAIAKYNPRLILGLGLHPRSKWVVLELAASGVVDYDRDEDGLSYHAYSIGRRLVLETQLPYKTVYQHCRVRRSLPLRLGLSTGSFLCNAIAYRIHEHALRLGVPGGFLHLPFDTNTAMRLRTSTHLPLSLIVETVRCVIEASITHATLE